jgi:hypothetical protein
MFKQAFGLISSGPTANAGSGRGDGVTEHITGVTRLTESRRNSGP